jgi:hypothetical protein
MELKNKLKLHKHVFKSFDELIKAKLIENCKNTVFIVDEREICQKMK